MYPGGSEWNACTRGLFDECNFYSEIRYGLLWTRRGWLCDVLCDDVVYVVCFEARERWVA